MNQYEVLHRPFNIDTHKETFVNYLEVVILSDGTVEYAVPSHQKKLEKLVLKQTGETDEELSDRIPESALWDYMEWLQEQCGAIAVWNGFYKGTPNQAQLDTLHELKDAGLYVGEV